LKQINPDFFFYWTAKAFERSAMAHSLRSPLGRRRKDEEVEEEEEGGGGGGGGGEEDLKTCSFIETCTRV
jgi:hypothetical protein